MKHRCPVCRKSIKAPAQKEGEEARFFPFCSQRCKLIDLGAWLDVEYKIISKLRAEQSAESSDTRPDDPTDKQ
ncbi:MAG: DNA gyrase inhibitor YacG [Planctomycetota bacterium]|jgi:endogenous inhibitor of DNA gyrase (YacG/DUF329 family)